MLVIWNKSDDHFSEVTVVVLGAALYAKRVGLKTSYGECEGPLVLTIANTFEKASLNNII